MNKIDFTNSGGQPIYNKDFNYIFSSDEGVYKQIASLMGGFGEYFIISGCTISGTDVSEGWIFIGGEIIKVDAHTKTDDYWEVTTTYNSEGYRLFKDGVYNDTWVEKRATLTASSGTLTYLGDRLSDLSTAERLLVRSSTGSESLRIKKTKLLEIGSWNMDANPSTFVVHGLTPTQITNLVGITAMIINDNNLYQMPFEIDARDGTDHILTVTDPTNILMTRNGSGVFDSTSYDDTTINRGWIKLEYFE